MIVGPSQTDLIKQLRNYKNKYKDMWGFGVLGFWGSKT